MQNITVTPVLIADSVDKEWTLEITLPSENKDRHVCISIKDVSSISLVEWYQFIEKNITIYISNCAFVFVSEPYVDNIKMTNLHGNIVISVPKIAFRTALMRAIFIATTLEYKIKPSPRTK